MNEEELIKKIEDIEGVIKIYSPYNRVDMINGESSITISVYFKTPKESEDE